MLYSARVHNLASEIFWGKNRGWTTSFQLFNFGLKIHKTSIYD